MSRLNTLQKLLDANPADTFVLYAIAMEHKKSGNGALAREWFDRVVAVDPNYSAAWHQKAISFEDEGDTEQAKVAYQQGIAAATRAGDAHARDEMAGALAML